MQLYDLNEAEAVSYTHLEIPIAEQASVMSVHKV